MGYEQATSFGELLKAFRKQKRIGQQQVAEQLGVHRNTIGAWERGDRLPDTRGMVLELARCLRLDEQETTRLLEASLTGVSTRWNVPYRRNPFFTGREELMPRLHTLLRQEKAAALTQSLVLSGLGGIGKTQMAVEYAYRYSQQYASIFWLNAETTESILSSYAVLATLLDLPEQQESDQQKVVAAVNRWLTAHRDWLLIVDNVEEHERIASVLPSSPEGCLLFTTRRQSLGMLAYPLEVERMSQEEGIRFLLHRSRRLSLDEPLDVCSFAEVMEAGKIVTEMEGLPLALDQAGAYIEETQCSLQDYFPLFQAHRTTLLGHRGGGGSDHPDSVAATLSLSIAAIAQQHPATVALLRVCALLHPDGIPEELFLEGGSHLGPELASACADRLSWNRLIATVSAYSLLKRQPKEKTLSMHRLVQAVLQDGMEEGEKETWNKRVITALDKVFPETKRVEPLHWEQCNRLLPHVINCMAQESPWQRDSREFASVLFKTAIYLRDRAQYEEAESLFLRALSIQEHTLSVEHVQVASTLYGLALLYNKQGKYEEAEPLYRRALHLRERALGSEHPDVAVSLVGLANLSYHQGKYKEAESLYRRALDIWERVAGSEHVWVALSLYHLGELFAEQGKCREAEQQYQRALGIWERALGPEHPSVADALHELAFGYRWQGKYEEAELLHRRALRIREQALGSEHPDVAHSLLGLGDLFCEQGKHAEAESLYRRALDIWERALRPEHPLMAYSLLSLGTVFKEQGRYEEAELFSLRALDIWERALGFDHPYVAYSLDNLADVYREQGAHEKAESLYQQALHIWQQTLGSEHLVVAHPLHGLALIYFQQGKYVEAEPLFLQALALQERYLDAQHIVTAELLHDFASFRRTQGRIEEATSFYRRALAIRERVLEADHPKTVKTRASYIALLRETGRQEEAEVLEEKSSEEVGRQ